MVFQGFFVYFVLILVMILFANRVAKQSSTIQIVNGNGKELPFFRFNIIFPFVLFSFVFGMRWNVGYDHIPYLFAYIFDDTERFEWGFRSITGLFQYFNVHYVFYFAFWAFLQICFFFLGFKYEYYLFPFLTLFIFTQSEVGFWMNGIRQSIAMCIILFSVKFIDEKKPLYYVLFSILAICFHRSAIVIVVFLYPLFVRGSNIFKSIILQYVLLGVAFVGHFVFNDYVPRFDSFLDVFNTMLGIAGSEVDYSMDQLSEIETNGKIGFVYIIRLIEVILIVACSKKMHLFYNTRRFNILYNLFFIGVFLNYLAPGNINNIDRLFRYFYIFRPVMLAYWAYYLYKTLKGSNLLLLWGILLCDIGGWVGANLKNGWPFDFFFQHDISEIMQYLK